MFVRPAGYGARMDGHAVGVTVGLWRRRVEGRTEAIRLVRLPDRRYLVLRTGKQPAEFPNQAQAELAVAKAIGDAWVYSPPPCRHGPRHAPRRERAL